MSQEIDVCSTETLEDEICSSGESCATSGSFASRRKVLPSAQDIYLSLSDRQLAFIGECRLLQTEEEESLLQSTLLLTTMNGLADDDDGVFLNSGDSSLSRESSPSNYSTVDSSYSSYGKGLRKPLKKLIPEEELSDPYHIPRHIIEYEESLDTVENELADRLRPFGRLRLSSISFAALAYLICNSILHFISSIAFLP